MTVDLRQATATAAVDGADATTTTTTAVRCRPSIGKLPTRLQGRRRAATRPHPRAESCIPEGAQYIEDGCGTTAAAPIDRRASVPAQRTSFRNLHHTLKPAPQSMHTFGGGDYGEGV